MAGFAEAEMLSLQARRATLRTARAAAESKSHMYEMGYQAKRLARIRDAIDTARIDLGGIPPEPGLGLRPMLEINEETSRAVDKQLLLGRRRRVLSAVREMANLHSLSDVEIESLPGFRERVIPALEREDQLMSLFDMQSFSRELHEFREFDFTERGIAYSDRATRYRETLRKLREFMKQKTGSGSRLVVREDILSELRQIATEMDNPPSPSTPGSRTPSTLPASPPSTASTASARSTPSTPPTVETAETKARQEAATPPTVETSETKARREVATPPTVETSATKARREAEFKRSMMDAIEKGDEKAMERLLERKISDDTINEAIERKLVEDPEFHFEPEEEGFIDVPLSESEAKEWASARVEVSSPLITPRGLTYLEEKVLHDIAADEVTGPWLQSMRQKSPSFNPFSDQQMQGVGDRIRSRLESIRQRASNEYIGNIFEEEREQKIPAFEIEEAQEEEPVGLSMYERDVLHPMRAQMMNRRELRPFAFSPDVRAENLRIEGERQQGFSGARAALQRMRERASSVSAAGSVRARQVAVRIAQAANRSGQFVQRMTADQVLVRMRAFFGGAAGFNNFLRRTAAKVVNYARRNPRTALGATAITITTAVALKLLSSENDDSEEKSAEITPPPARPKEVDPDATSERLKRIGERFEWFIKGNIDPFGINEEVIDATAKALKPEKTKETPSSPGVDFKSRDVTADLLVDDYLVELQSQDGDETNSPAISYMRGSAMRMPLCHLPLGQQDPLRTKSTPIFPTSTMTPAEFEYRYEMLTHQNMRGDNLSEFQNDKRAKQLRTRIPTATSVLKADPNHPNERYAPATDSRIQLRRIAATGRLNASTIGDGMDRMHQFWTSANLRKDTRMTEALAPLDYDTRFVPGIPGSVDTFTSVDWRPYNPSQPMAPTFLEDAPAVVGIGFDEQTFSAVEQPAHERKVSPEIASNPDKLNAATIPEAPKSALRVDKSQEEVTQNAPRRARDELNAANQMYTRARPKPPQPMKRKNPDYESIPMTIGSNKSMM